MKKTLLLGLFLLVGYVLNAQTNLIQNPSFEEAGLVVAKQNTDRFTDAHPNKWIHTLKSTEAGAVNIVNTEFNEGTSSLELEVVTITDRNKTLLSYELTDLAPAKYTYSFYAKTNVENMSFRMEAKVFDAAGVNSAHKDTPVLHLIGEGTPVNGVYPSHPTNVGRVGLAKTATSTWTKYSFEIDASHLTADQLKFVHLIIRPNCALAGAVTKAPSKFWFDSFEFLPETTPPPSSEITEINLGAELTAGLEFSVGAPDFSILTPSPLFSVLPVTEPLSKVSYSSNNPQVADIENGVLKIKNIAGQSTITLSAGTIKKTFTVRVTDTPTTKVNVMKNPGFEEAGGTITKLTNDLKTGEVTDQWVHVLKGANDKGNASIVATESFDGDKSMNIEIEEITERYRNYLVYDVLDLQPDTYTFSFLAKSSVDMPFRVEVLSFDQSGFTHGTNPGQLAETKTFLVKPSGYETSVTDWTKYTYTIDATNLAVADMKIMRFYIRPNCQLDDKVTKVPSKFWFDNFELTGASGVTEEVITEINLGAELTAGLEYPIGNPDVNILSPALFTIEPGTASLSKVTYSANNPGVADIENGVLKIKDIAGQSTITLSAGTIKKTFTVRVTDTPTTKVNVMKNPGFEEAGGTITKLTNDLKTGEVTDQWVHVLKGANDKGNASIVATESFDGDKSMNIEIEEITERYRNYLVYDVLDLQPDTYTFSFLAKSSVDMPFRVEVLSFDQSGFTHGTNPGQLAETKTFLVKPSGYETSVTDWTKYTYTIDATNLAVADMKIMRFYIRPNCQLDDKVTKVPSKFWFDNFELTGASGVTEEVITEINLGAELTAGLEYPIGNPDVNILSPALFTIEPGTASLSKVTYSANNPGVADIENGVLKIKDIAGQSTITLSAGTIKKTFTVRVTDTPTTKVNVLKNPGFEEVTNLPELIVKNPNVGAYSDNWVLTNIPSSDGDVAVVSDELFTGSKSMKVNLDAIDFRYRFFLFQDVKGLTPDTYTFSFYQKSDVADMPFRVEVVAFDDEGKQHGNNAATQLKGIDLLNGVNGVEKTTTLDWTKYTYTIDATALTAEQLKVVRFYIRPNCSQNGNITNTPVTYWFDDFELLPETTPPVIGDEITAINLSPKLAQGLEFSVGDPEYSILAPPLFSVLPAEASLSQVSYSSNNPQVADIVDGVLKIKDVSGQSTITLSAGSIKTTFTVRVNDIPSTKRNAMKNPGFEDAGGQIISSSADPTLGTDLDTWVHVLKTGSENADDGEVSIVSDESYDGSQSMKLELRDITARYRFFMYQNIAGLTPGAYTFSFYAKATKENIPFRIEADFANAGGTVVINMLGEKGKAEKTTLDWIKYTFTLDATALTQAQMNNLQLTIRPNTQQGGAIDATKPVTYWFDNFELLTPEELVIEDITAITLGDKLKEGLTFYEGDATFSIINPMLFTLNPANGLLSDLKYTVTDATVADVTGGMVSIGNKGVSKVVISSIKTPTVKSEEFTITVKEREEGLLRIILGDKLKKGLVFTVGDKSMSLVSPERLFTLDPADISVSDITYTSSDVEVADIKNGVVKLGSKIGVTKVILSSVSKPHIKSDEFTITVNDKAPETGVTKITLGDKLKKGLEFMVGDADFSIVKPMLFTLDPTNTPLTDMVYTVSDASVANVVAGVVKVGKIGTSKVVISSKEKPTVKSAEFTITVKKFEEPKSDDVEVHELLINGRPWSDIGEVFNLECGADKKVSVELVIDDKATVNSKKKFDVEFEGYPTIVEHKFTVTAEDKVTKKEYVLKLANNKFNFNDIVIQKFNSRLIVNNNPNTNGGFSFKKYQWFVDGNPVEGGQVYSSGKEQLSPTSIYNVVLTDKENNKYEVCPAQPVLRNVSMKVYPNPVNAGQSVDIEANLPDEDSYKNTTVTVYTIAGAPVMNIQLTGQQTTFTAPTVSGIYMIRVAGTDISKEFKLIVK